jgi:hypothetical protein
MFRLSVNEKESGKKNDRVHDKYFFDRIKVIVLLIHTLYPKGVIIYLNIEHKHRPYMEKKEYQFEQYGKIRSRTNHLPGRMAHLDFFLQENYSA